MLPKRFTAWLTINRACNLRCSWCYAKTTGFGGVEDIEIDTVERAIGLLSGLPVKNVIIIGGEPTIHPEFIKIIRMIKRAGLKPLLVTNSLKFKDRNFLDEALDAGIDGINTSLKASSESEYQEFTGRRAFSDVVEAIHNIEKKRMESGFSHQVCVTVCEGIFDTFNQMVSVIRDTGVATFSLDMERPVVANGQIYSPGKATPQEMADFFVKVYPSLDNCGVRFIIRVSIPFCLFPQWFIDDLVEKDRIISGCQLLGGNGIIIDPKGRLLPCNHLCSNPIGRIGVDFTTAEDYLLFRQQQEVVAFYKKIMGCPHQDCVQCKQWKFCGGGCRIQWLYRKADELLGRKKGGKQ